MIAQEHYRRFITVAFLSDSVVAFGGEDQQITVRDFLKQEDLHVLSGFENRFA